MAVPRSHLFLPPLGTDQPHRSLVSNVQLPVVAFVGLAVVGFLVVGLLVEAAARHRRLRRTCEQTMSRRSSESSTGQHNSVVVELVMLQCCHSTMWRPTRSHWAKCESQQAQRHALQLASELTCCTEHDRVDGHVPSVACAFHAHELNSRRAAGQVDLRRGVATCVPGESNIHLWCSSFLSKLAERMS